MEEKLTVENVLKNIAKDLGCIQVPVELIEQIGFPIKRAISNLNACLEAIQEAKVKEESAKEINLVEMDNEPATEQETE